MIRRPNPAYGVENRAGSLKQLSVRAALYYSKKHRESDPTNGTGIGEGGIGEGGIGE
jgi:hypothetical protein